jgi:hypothetical protein
MPEQAQGDTAVVTGEQLQASERELHFSDRGRTRLCSPPAVPAQSSSLEPVRGEPGEQIAELERVRDIQLPEFPRRGVGFEHVAVVDCPA